MTKARYAFLGTIFALLTSAIGTPFSSAQSAAEFAPKGRLKIWHVNLHKLLDAESRFISVMARSYLKPDVITVSGVERTQIAELRDDISMAIYGEVGRYKMQHGDNNPDSTTSNVAIIYNDDRLDFIERKSWLVSEAEDCADITATNGQIAAEFRIDEGPEKLYVASLHLPLNGKNELGQDRVGVSQECMDDALSLTNQKLDSLAKVGELNTQRHISVIAGDFNKNPAEDSDPPCDAVDTDCPGGYEITPECWYRDFSAGVNTSAGLNPSFPKCTDALGSRSDAGSPDRYYDSVAERNWTPITLTTGNDPESAMCQQWTHGKDANNGAYDPLGASSSCTNALDEAGRVRATFGGTSTGNGLKRDKSRIDYIWVRWEDSNQAGFSQAQARERIQEATVDLSAPHPGGPSDSKYSDHRAVTATIAY